MTMRDNLSIQVILTLEPTVRTYVRSSYELKVTTYSFFLIQRQTDDGRTNAPRTLSSHLHHKRSNVCLDETQIRYKFLKNYFFCHTERGRVCRITTHAPIIIIRTAQNIYSLIARCEYCPPPQSPHAFVNDIQTRCCLGVARRHDHPLPLLNNNGHGPTGPGLYSVQEHLCRWDGIV